MCGEAEMEELLGCVGKLRWPNHGKVWVKLRWLKPIRHKRGFLWGEMLTLVVKPQWVHYKLDEVIEKPCSDLLASHQRKCESAWSAWENGDLSHLTIGNKITSHGECV
jgi:hypothetical protein